MASIGPVNVKVGMDSSEFRAGSRKMNVGIKNIEKEVGGIKRSMASWRRDAKRIYRETRTPLERYRTEVAKLNTIYKQGHFGIDTYRRALRRLKEEQRAASSGAVVAAGRFAKLGPIFARLRWLVGGYAAIWTGRKIIGASEGFAQAMSSSLAIVGKVSDETRAKMEAVAHTAAYDVKASAEEAAQGYYYLFSAGMDVERAMAALPSVTKFAQAGMFDLARATELATDAQSAMGMKSKDPQQNLKNLTRVMDALVGGNTLADATTEEFAEALAKSGASLRTLNKDVEEGVAILAAFAEQGYKGADGAQQLNITLRNLQLKAIENEKAFKRHGIAVYDDAGKMRVTAEIIKDLERKYTGLSDKQRVQMLMELGFTQKSIKSMQVLVGYGAEIEHWTERLKDMTGVTEDVSDRQLPALTKGWNKLKAAMAETAIATVTESLELLGGSLERIADVISGRGTAEGSGGLLREIQEIQLAGLKLLKWNEEWKLSFREAAEKNAKVGDWLARKIRPDLWIRERLPGGLPGPSEQVKEAQRHIATTKNNLENLNSAIAKMENKLSWGPLLDEAEARFAGEEVGRELGEGLGEGFEEGLEASVRNPLEDLLAQYTKTYERMGMDEWQTGGMAIVDAFEEFRKLRSEHGGALEEFDAIGASRKLEFMNDQNAQKKKFLEMEKEGKALRERHATPEEQFDTRLKDVAKLLEVGAIDKRTAMMEMQSFGAGLGLDDTQKPPTALVRGSREEYNQRIAMERGDPMTKLLKTAEAELDVAEKTLSESEDFHRDWRNATPLTISAPP